MKIRTCRWWKPGRGAGDYGNRGADLSIDTLGRWVRICVAIGTPPGSHIGLWRTNGYGLRGLNLRIGRRIAGPCLTVFIHTHRSWTYDRHPEGA